MRSLIILKPDTVIRGLVGNVLNRLELKGIKLRYLQMHKFSKEEIKMFYAPHVDKHFFSELVIFMSSGPSVICIVEAENIFPKILQLRGDTKLESQLAGTIRGDLAEGTMKNILHSSSDETEFNREIVCLSQILGDKLIL